MFKNQILLITGGTGSFGNAVLQRFLDTDIKEIRIFSRDELKQDDMRKRYNNDKLKFYIGDVRDINSLKDAMREVTIHDAIGAFVNVVDCIGNRARERDANNERDDLEDQEERG